MIGRKLDVAKEQKGWIEEAGFVDVTARVVKVRSSEGCEGREIRGLLWKIS